MNVMKRLRPLVVTIAVLVTSFIGGIAVTTVSASTACKSTDAFCLAPGLASAPNRIDSVNVPKIATPAWLSTQAPTENAREVTYTVATRGNITADVDEFADILNQTLNSPLGWSRLGIRWVRVDSGGQMTAYLSENTHMTDFSATGCDATVSCTVGDSIIINQDRWLNGSDSWNAAGGSLSDYRHMVLNHETGHWLGHGHEYCPGAGQPAPVMQQQTIDMQGCTPNPWPLDNELYSPKLGIRS